MSIDNDSVMLGIAGLGARLALEHNFSSLPDDENQVITLNEGLILHFHCRVNVSSSLQRQLKPRN